MAQEALQLHIHGMEEDGDEIPAPTSPEKIKAPDGGFVTLAEERRINFSQVLQSALKERLGIPEPR